MKLKAIIRPFVFTKEGLIDRGYRWIAEWLELGAIVVYLLTLGYIDPCWKFRFLTWVRNKTYHPTYDE